MPALSTLRAATNAAHERLNVVLAPERLMADRSSYAAFLAALYGFHRAVEGALDGELIAGIAPLERSTLLADDLRALGVEAAELPLMPWSVPDGEGERAGVGYVIEGSALGGVVLGRMAREQLGVGPAGGAAFFARGADCGARWRAVKAALEAQLDGARLAAAAEAAAVTFTQLERWMTVRGLAAARP